MTLRARTPSRSGTGNLLALIAIIALAGCSVVDSPTLSVESAAVDDASGPLLPLYLDATGAFPAAQLIGHLLVEDRCVYVADEYDPGTRWLVLLPPDTIWDNDSLVLRGQRYSPGDRLEVGGGERSSNKLHSLSQLPDPSCDTTDVWLVSPYG